MNIHVGDGCFINYNCTFLDVAPITLGNGGVDRRERDAGNAEPPIPCRGRLPSDYPDGHHGLEYAAPITIGDGCWLCSGVTVCGGVTIGENCVIAAGAVVNRDIPPNCIAAGVPARVIRKLDEQDRINMWGDLYGERPARVGAEKRK